MKPWNKMKKEEIGLRRAEFDNIVNQIVEKQAEDHTDEENLVVRPHKNQVKLGQWR